MRSCLLICGLSLLTFATHLIAQPALAFVDAVSGFANPVDITGAGDGSDRLFVVQRNGEIRIIDQTTNTVVGAPFLDITGRVRSGGERGLLGLAFHPDFANNGYFYVNYTTEARNGLAAGTTVIARFTAAGAGSVADPNSELQLLTVNQDFANHNGGDLAFGPDGFLYIGTGDGGSGGDPLDRAQDFTQLLGKMLRIDVDNPSGGRNYGIPATNPYQAAGDGIPDEIFATGLRNPWRIGFDRATGDLWIGDVGQVQREEVDVIPAGAAGGLNFGWDCREGNIAYTSDPSPQCGNGSVYTDPVFDYDRGSTGGKSITGGFVYRGSAADLQGHYVAVDYVSNRFFLYELSTNTLSRQLPGAVSNVSTFGEDDAGELYLAELNTGTVYRVTTQLALPAELTNWTATARGKTVELAWTTAQEAGVADYLLERSLDGETFTTLTALTARNSPTGATYNYTDGTPPAAHVYYRLTSRDLDGSERRYGVRSVLLDAEAGGEPVLSPNPTAGDVQLTVPELQYPGPVGLQLIATDGRVVYRRARLEAAGPLQLNYALPPLPAGVYHARITYDGRTFSRRLTVR